MAKKGKALVLDDDQFTRNAIKTYLSIIGFEVVMAQDGLDGLDKLEKLGTVELIFSDYEMPNMNGLQFAERVRREEKWNSIPLVMLTSVDKQDIIDRAKNLGVSGYMVKPFNNQKMHEVLTRLGFVS